MKVGIIGPFERNEMPYISYYEDALNKKQIDYECIFWNRNKNGDIQKKDRCYTINIKCLMGINKIEKLMPIIKYMYYLNRILKKENYTHLIILNTIPSILISYILLNDYKSKYILDIRDYSYEKYKIYRNRVEKIIENSYFTAISSEGFKSFLPDSRKLITCHNISNLEEKLEECNNIKEQACVKIGFVGLVRYFNENSKLIKTLANNSQYELVYYGKTHVNCNLVDYCKQIKAKNIIFYGEFKNNEKPKIYQNIDMINAIYGNKSLEVTTALPNRLYDGVLFKKPIIATSGTYLGEIVEKHKLGIAINIEDDERNIRNKIDNYIANFDSEKFVNHCNEFLSLALKQQRAFQNKVLNFINQ